MGILGDIFGGSQSTSNVTTKVSQVIDNNTDLKIIKENINKNIMNTINNASSSCSASAIASQNISRKFHIGKGAKVNIGSAEQEQKVSLKLSCIDVSSMQNNMANDIANAFANQLSTKFDNSAMAKLDANAKAQAVSGVLPLGSTTTNSNVNQTYDLKINNKISKTMRDMITNETQKNFSTTTLKERLAQLQALQTNKDEFDIDADSDVKLGNTKQTQVADLVMDAIAKDETINKTIEKISTQLNNINTDGVSSNAIANVTASATAESEQKGVDSIVDSIGKTIGGVFGSWTNMITIIIVVIVIAIIIALVVFMRSGGLDIAKEVALKKMKGGFKNSVDYTVFGKELKNIIKNINSKKF